MRQWLRSHLTYANVIATIALFLALGGGGFAVASHLVVQTSDIVNGAVTFPKLGCKGNSPADVMVRAGSVCIDKYENSIWTAKTGGTRITGAIPCAANGSTCKGKIFARSVAGVAPRANITYFQAQQALANSDKRLPTNAEWQQAVAGTPGGAPCNVSSAGPVNTGASTGCVSRWGANDMVGNLFEWVADWVPRSAACGSWPPGYGGDYQCFAGAATEGAPGALVRGGGWNEGSVAGSFAVTSGFEPVSADARLGFRGAR